MNKDEEHRTLYHSERSAAARINHVMAHLDLVLEGLDLVLKGRGFSRAVNASKSIAALAAVGMSF
jgi:hypothetical protein